MLPVQLSNTYPKSTYPLVSVTLAGLKNSGKTSFLKKLMTGVFDESDPDATLGVNVEIIHWKYNGREKKFRFFDMSGHVSFRSTLWPRYISISQGLVYIVSCDEPEFTQALDTFREVLQLLQKDTRVLLIGNKCDLIANGCLETVMKIFRLENLSIRTGIELKFLLVSVKTGYNLKTAFDWLVTSF